jgi:uncharacterized protein (DUF433 family)
MDADSRAWLDDTNVKVIEVVLDHVAYGWSAEEIHRQHPHLSLSQVYAALAYYYDHQAEFDAQMEHWTQRASAGTRTHAFRQVATGIGTPLP